MSPEQLLVLMQSFIACLLVIFPILLIARMVYRNMIPDTHMLRMSNWTDSVVRPVALCLFLLMLGFAFYLFFIKPDYYALISPVEFVLGFFFFPLYKKMN